MAKRDPFPVGYVCPATKRVAVLVKDYADSDLNGEVSAYWFSRVADECNMDPWRLVDGVDHHIKGVSMDVWFADGGTTIVGPLMTFFMAAADAERLRVVSRMGESAA